MWTRRSFLLTPLPLMAQTALAGERLRVLVSTDAGGTDPDDLQSLVHLLLYADVLDLEGILSSPYGPGRLHHILHVIDHYQQDFPRLHARFPRYPTPDTLRALCHQGATEDPGPTGTARPTPGSQWLIQCARRPDPRPLYVLVWGGLEDLAQALHDAPDILPKLRVYFIGGPNKMWSVNAYNYVHEHHPALWMIENNSTYRGWFVGGNQVGEWGNRAFTEAHAAGRGALGDYFASILKATIKMGDSPSVGYLLHGNPADPAQPGWGGRFVRLWPGRKTVFPGLTTAADQAEVFGVVEFTIPIPERFPPGHDTRMLVDNRIPAPAFIDGRVLRFRFSPRDAKIWPYVIESLYPPFHGQTGAFTATPPPRERTRQPDPGHPNWWIDDPDPAAAEGIHPGAKHVNLWRTEFLKDFAARLERCQPI
ncbi:MAG: DUF1593 domain-containing protein [Bryobacteraceae bacterium]|nr:DUF1593 domain-containing protein [Bryobacteraceae bacterium]